MREIWKDVKGYEGLYQVSNLGRVKSIRKKRMMHPNDNGKGYLMVQLKADNKRKVKYIHRLVVEHFLCADIGCNEVNHKNGNKADNRLCNLEVISHSANIKHAYDNNLFPDRTGDNNPNSRKRRLSHAQG